MAKSVSFGGQCEKEKEKNRSDLIWKSLLQPWDEVAQQQGSKEPPNSVKTFNQYNGTKQTSSFLEKGRKVPLFYGKLYLIAKTLILRD